MKNKHARSGRTWSGRTWIGRRRFLKYSIGGLGLTLSGPALLPSVPGGAKHDAAEHDAAEHDAAAPLREVSASKAPVIVFQGDSVTDAGRRKDDQRPNLPHALGYGYAGISAAQLLAMRPASRWQCYNRGVSGNKVFQLAERWEEDCLALAPDVLSILIGVNDFWHTLTSGYEGTVETYERDYRALLDCTQEALPEVKLIIGEPFALLGGSAVDEKWYPAFSAYQAAAKRAAADYGAVWIPYQPLFDEALAEAPADYWTLDGVHPAPPGNHLMAQAWLKGLERALA